MTQTSWFALEITVQPEAAEAIEFALNELDALGTEINHLGKKAAETLKVVGYFNEKPADENVRRHVSDALEIYGLTQAAVARSEWREVANEDWLAEWKKHWRPTVTDRFIIAPTWETIETTGKIVIRIEPSMAFGTGTHETTRLCLRAVEHNFKREMSFFDVGTGTGILAIAALKLAELEKPQTENQNPKIEIAGCDTDEDSIRIARENAELNDAQGIEFYVGSIARETPVYDFVCANLTADVIAPLLPLLIEKSRRFLVLSGILREQEKLITEELEKLRISNFKIETDGEWISVLMNNG